MPSPPLPSLAQSERARLRLFEAAYAQWQQAEAAVAEAEIRLWSEALSGADAETRRRLGAESLALRAAARAARENVLALLRQVVAPTLIHVK